MASERKAIFENKYTKELVGSALPYEEENTPVKDGDTLSIRFNGSIHTRLLNIDTAEKGLYLPDAVKELLTPEEQEQWNSLYRPINHYRWVEYLTDPFSSRYSDSTIYRDKLGVELVGYLQNKLGDDCAINHYDFSKKASDVLTKKIKVDREEVESTGKQFGFRLGFSHELFDRYGRTLCYMSKASVRDGYLQNLDQDPLQTYNEMMLATGNASPYFIFPSTDGFQKSYNHTFSLLKSIPDVTTDREAFYNFMQADTSLQKARNLVRDSRSISNSIWDPNRPLKLMAFELRYLQRRGLPDRYVMDLSSKEPKIYPPRQYHVIPLEEDRFYIPYDYLLLFSCRGYEIVGENVDCKDR